MTVMIRSRAMPEPCPHVAAIDQVRALRGVTLSCFAGDSFAEY